MNLSLQDEKQQQQHYFRQDITNYALIIVSFSEIKRLIANFNKAVFF